MSERYFFPVENNGKKPEAIIDYVTISFAYIH